MQRCPFCGAEESDRLDVDGHRFLVFACMFTPEVDRALGEAELADHLARTYSGPSQPHFQSLCDRLHLVVTRPGA